MSFRVFLLSRTGGSWPAEAGSGSQHAHFGKLIGTLNNAQSHGIRGDIYAVDARTLFIKGFSYDGKGRGKLRDSQSSTARVPFYIVHPLSSWHHRFPSISPENAIFKKVISRFIAAFDEKVVTP